MQEIMSRKERLEGKLEEASRRKAWGYQARLYFSEITRIKKQWGVEVTITRMYEEAAMADCDIWWNNAFYPDGMNFQQSLYISMLQDEMPEVKNFAQKLFLITARA